jgi:SAM-dependent methyltransferase
MTWYETAFAAHYPWLYRHRDDAEAKRCVQNLSRLAPLGDGPVLDLACGEGRHLVHLAPLPPFAVGLDLSPALLTRARQRRQQCGCDFPLIRGDMRRLPCRSSGFTAVLSLFTAFGYFGSLADHEGMVGEVARILTPDGHWFLDYLNCDAVTRELSGPTDQGQERQDPPFLIQEKRRLDRDPPRVRKSVFLWPLPGHEDEAAALGVAPAGLFYEERVALFSLAELDGLVARYGLQRVASAGGYAAEPLDPETSPRWLLVFQKRDTATN